MKIVYLDSFALNPGDLDFGELKALGEIEIYDRTTNTKDAIERIGDAEAVILNKVQMTREVFDACPNIKFLAVTATGYNNVDIDVARERGIKVSNVPAYSTPSVAQHIFALLLEICMRTGDHSKAVKEGMWQKCPDYTFHISNLIELSGKTMGFIGMGEIGSAAARIAKAFGMRVICYHSRRDLDGVLHVDLDTLLKESDVISLCCPLTEDNKKIIRKETIDKMKDSVIIINTARGGLIDEDDLADAVKSGKVSGVGIDVLDCEPPVNSSPLINLEEVVVTPHIAWAPKESRNRLLKVTIENVKSYINNNVQNDVTRR
ncbi:MAG: D-2-hydroxyacid dehydrogenase [Ruminococcaceae bacterium]|nr:D-2-hydroxyacid dehydrogenase [Oscillospiraceae bacterium]